MAKMYPPKPREIQAGSREDYMFDLLATLPDDYYVFHSFAIVHEVKDLLKESETDFVIFHDCYYYCFIVTFSPSD